MTSLERRDASVLFGIEIRRLRRASGLSQEDLADLAGLDRTTIGRIERGEFRATLDVAEAMAQACGKPLSEVFTAIEGSRIA